MGLKKIRWYDPALVAVKVAAARILARILPSGDKPIVLVGGNLGEKYEDNASVFHTYLTRERPDLKTYWLYDRSSNYVKREGIRNAVPLGSFRNYVLFFRADYTFHGHSILYDLAPGIDPYIHHNKKTIMTHISHGIEGFKKILIQPEDVPLLRRTDYFNCASDYERDIKLNGWGFPPEKLIITGMARFDRLEPDSPAPEVRNILVMMTWREWLFGLTDEQFMESEYFRRTVGMLEDPGIRRLIRERGLHVKVALHPFMKRFESVFRNLPGSSRIRFVSFDEISVKEEVIRADMLLTDYTSVSWDFLYQNKPIIFYMFDQEELEEKRGTYLDLDGDLYGYKARTAEEVTNLLDRITAGANTNPFYEKAPHYFGYFDRENCRRLADKVIGPVPSEDRPPMMARKTVPAE
ncbi:CDP-glycerol glycerophosphotransferase family protein [Edaphobacillus lindanitolerans]|uniref:CDP-glycerol glycerophosphotransferase, TagB/SpsB family n=1 Tax=Edaphobacillus lindanitolerans TaxID=550447 RepID=A0A1U7PU51_9BACI|nr:CDP-glycerol glycerophosphotransferase family protein [Edaphobacillus lindanitolerans]SIT93454.1 CDP-glycerol glycerophosphotransferase, TagB/SpsB family [Edaphobacillus lindanitolerans]